jgi:hypothetical protein
MAGPRPTLGIGLMHRESFHTPWRLYGLAALALAALLLGGCASFGDKPPVYEKDGVRYGVTKGTFRSRWWNYYQRGCSYLDGGYYKEAEQDFRAALQGRAKDQRWPRTYGLHFIPEYFPNRELGIALYHQQQVDESLRRLESSLEQRFSARAAFYLGEARTVWLAGNGKDAAPPEIEITSPAGGAVVGAAEVTLEGIARDDTFVSSIKIDQQDIDVRVSAAAVPFKRTVPLNPLQNTIRVEVADLTGKTSVVNIPIVSDVDGPLVSFDVPVVLPGALRGVAFDPSGVAALRVAGKEAALAPSEEGTVAFAVELAKEDMTPPLRFECLDKLGNSTNGEPPLDLLVLNPRFPEVVFSSGPGDCVPLGGGLYALLVNGESVAVAAVPVQQGGVTIEMSNIREGQQYYMDEIVVALKVQADSPVRDIELNGQPVPVFPGRNSMRMSRRMRLEAGDNPLTAKAVDAGGAEGVDQKTVRREPGVTDMTKGKLAVAFLGGVGATTYPEAEADVEYILNALAATEPVQKRFSVVDRSLLQDILAEQNLSEALASSKNKLALGKLIPAELMIAARVRRDQESIEILLEGISTETAVRILPQVEVAGPYADLDRLIEELGIRLAQELPRVRGRVLQWDQPEITTDLNAAQGIRDSLKCLVFRTEPVTHPDTGESLGEKPVILGTGLINNVTEKFSTAEILPLEEEQGLVTPNIEAGHHVVIK